MADAAIRRMTADEFLAWHLRQERRYELVDGVPVAMAGAKRRHDHVVVNALRELSLQLRGKPCRPFSSDTAIRIPSGNIRYPDAGVDCGRFLDETTWADAPALVVEVLSASTRDFDLFRKLDEYKSVPSLRHVVLVNPDAAELIHWLRAGADAWSSHDIIGLDARLELPDLGLSLALSELYEGLGMMPGSEQS